MLTKNEVTSLNLSPTKKDFVQIWNELLDISSKLSERWDPTSTNESDPGIVILKALTGIADKLNYNIDKNILEAFMPTAAQEDSMRKLCDILGYTMKYYRSAETAVTVKYYNSEPSDDEAAQMNPSMGGGLDIPKFTVITNSDKDISYFTLDTFADTRYDSYRISSKNPVVVIPCMEGQIVKCESINDNNVITANQVSERNRFYLPETQIAENGIFVYNVTSSHGSLVDGEKWTKVDNLNVLARGSRVFKFGFDSYESRPYIEFPEDFSSLFKEGVFIYYARTSGVNGNVSARTLKQLEVPSAGGWENVAAESFSAYNVSPATSGSNPESIKQAYNNFKKTIGTFETLVTCRDYMNKIYSLMLDGEPLVSNVRVTDIRNDLNKAVIICSCDDAGIFYKETAKPLGLEVIGASRTEKSVEEATETSVSDWETLEEVYETTDELVHTEETVEGDEGELETETVEASTTNKPRYVNHAGYFSYGNWASGSGYIERFASWYLGDSNLPLFNDDYSKDLVDDATFVANLGGEVLEYVDPEKTIRSNYWLIVQNGKTYTTKLPIDWVVTKKTIKGPSIVRTNYLSSTKIVKEQRTETITNNKTVHVNTFTDGYEMVNLIDHFDLVLYPFKTYKQITSNVKSNIEDIRPVYDASFTYSETNIASIADAIKDVKTVAHNIKTPDIDDILSINNYLRLNVTIATNTKVTQDEGDIIKDNIKIALANAFNMRELDFGEEIPFDSIVEVIENADPRIRVASINEPTLYTTFSVLEAGATTREYAVASTWLNADMAESTGRLVTDRGDTTFDTAKARDIYNKLAVRNVLAGRVPLFDYHITFKTGFNERAYQVTESLTAENGLTKCLEEMPLLTATAKNPNTIHVDDNNVTYLGKYDGNKATYTKTYSPEKYKNSIIAEKKDDSGIDNYITNISTNCELVVDEDNKISDITLASGEFVRFRAPNFVTRKTYPAYVNYYLDLGTELQAEPVPAEAVSLFNLLDGDRAKWSQENTAVRWQKVLDYFSKLDADAGTSYKKMLTLAQKITARVENDQVNLESEGTTTLSVGLSNTAIEDTDYTIATLMERCGCVKFAGNDFKVRIAWTPLEGESAPSKQVPLDIVLTDFKNPFITNENVLYELPGAINSLLAAYGTNLPEECTKCAFTVYLDFECVPFEAESKTAWEGFIKRCLDNYHNNEYDYQVLDFVPFDEDNTLFWRLSDEGYEAGKYVTQETKKLLKFTKSHFSLLSSDGDAYLQGVYLIKYIGADAKPTSIKNSEEYTLAKGEFLYIEYTPSSTTEDDTAKNTAAITEVYGEGTIIRPSGFDAGMIDSAVYASLGNTPHKTVTFKLPTKLGGGVVNKAVHSLSASEQIEIRDVAAVTLPNSDKSGEQGSVAYFYKNFDCLELENRNGNNGVRTYTLKDGEYIFYTDQNQAEFAYYTSGTQVTVSGKFTLPKFDVVELSTLLDYGPSKIQWYKYAFTGNDKITFQEYQYVTLGPTDTIKEIELVSNNMDESIGSLSDSWRFCKSVKYYLSGDPETEITLPAIATSLPDEYEDRKGNGWEACCTLELDVTSNTAQTLRSTPKIKTSVSLSRTSATGGKVSLDDYDPKVEPLVSGIGLAGSTKPLYFKTNLACQACGNEISIDDIYTNYPKLKGKTKGFQIKVFAEDAPVIVKTTAGKVTPRLKDNITDILNWHGNTLSHVKDPIDLWNQVELDDIKVEQTDADDGSSYDNALRLPVNVLPGTYGIFSIYLDCPRISTDTSAKTWIEVLPGTALTDVALLNDPNADVEELKLNEKTGLTGLAKLYLNPGVNCVRVNKPGTLFIKTSAKSSGTLYFDELRLVNCQAVKYDNDTVVGHTCGLNLQQLGYLDTSNDKEALTKDAKTAIKLAEAANTLSAINKIKAELDAKVYAGYDSAVALLPKVTELAAVERIINEELAVLSKINKDELKKLIDKYKEISTMLQNEQALLKALSNNAKADELEQRLMTLLAGLPTVEHSKQQIFTGLAEIKDIAENVISKMSDSTILSDFSSSSELEKEKVLSIVSSHVVTAVNSFYQEQLEKIARNLDSTANSAGKNTLLSILSSLRATAIAGDVAVLQAKVTELGQIIEATETDRLLEAITEATAEQNYVQLLSLLTQLRNTIDSNDARSLISEMSTLMSESSYAQLADLLAPLFSDTEGGKVFNPAALAILVGGATNTILGKIDSLISLLNSKLINKDSIAAADKTAVIEAVEGADGIKKAIYSDYLAKLKTLFEAINDRLELIVPTDNEILSAISSLRDTEDSQVITIIEQLRVLIAERNAYVYGTFDGDNKLIKAGLNDFVNKKTFDGWELNTCDAFIKEAILTNWPQYMRIQITTAISEIEELFTKALADGFDEVDTNKTALLAKLADVPSSIDAEAVTVLFNDIKMLLSAQEQNSVVATLVTDLSDLLQDSKELTDAMAAVGYNTTIATLITDWKAANENNRVVQKQQIQNKLKEALTKTIATSSQLFDVISDALFPCITRYEKTLDPADELYKRLLVDNGEKDDTGKAIGALTFLKNKILANSVIDDLYLAKDYETYLPLLQLSFETFRNSLLSFDLSKATLLPNSLLAKLTELKRLVDTTNIVGADFTIISSADLVSASQSSLEVLRMKVKNELVITALNRFITKAASLDQLNRISTGFEEAYKVLRLEQQLLDDIIKLDVNREFYYNVPVEANMAIELNEGDKNLNTLMNPRANYDVNNVNNCFVISKLDIDYLDDGITIARSSRLN